IRIMDRHFEGVAYSLKSLFRDEQRRAVQQILESTLGEAENSYRQIYEHHATLLRFLSDIHQPVPRVLSLTAEFVLNGALRRALEESELDFDRIHALLESAEREGVNLDSTGLEFLLRRRLGHVMDSLAEDPASLERLQRAHAMPFQVNIWHAQNVYYDLLQHYLAQQQERGERAWVDTFVSLGDLLGVE